MKISLRFLKALSVGVLLAIPMGCAPDAPTGPTPTQPVAAPQASLIGDLVGLVDGATGEVVGVVGTTTEAVGGVVNALLDPLLCPTDVGYTASKKIGPFGGTLRVGPHTLTVPAGALWVDTWITATAPKGKYAEVQFEPHGLKFKRDVTLSISYAQCGLLSWSKPPVIVYTDDNRTILEILESVLNPRTETITGKTDHFSSYILAES
jgi:hypothetical protein